MEKRIERREDQLQFLEAGHAVFTVQNTKTGNRFTFKVERPDEDWPYLVKLLDRPDNERGYTYMGAFRQGQNLHTTKASKVGEDAQSFKVFRWVYAKLHEEGLPKSVEFWHEGRCGRCGRRLTVPESIERGIGPVCAEAL